MYSRQGYAASIYRKAVMCILAVLLVVTAAPISPAKASTEPEVLPIYVGLEKFEHIGNNANVSNDRTRGLLFPTDPQRNNAATTANGRLRVVPVTNGSSGIVVRTNKIKLDGGFSTYFVMHLNGSTSLNNTGFPGPADGLTFIIQDNPQPVLGGIGEGVGYAGIPNSIGVEFDTWKNDGAMNLGLYYDPNTAFNRTNKYHPVTNPNGPTADHVAIVVNGNNTHAPGNGDVVDNLQGANFRLYDYANSNAYVHVWVDYDDDGKLTTTYGLSANRRDANNRSITRNVGMSLMNKEVYVGFGASTGGANSHHDILAWYFKNTYVEGGLDPNGNYRQGPTAVTIDKDVPEDGTVTGLDIRVKGNSINDNLPNEKVDIFINNQLVVGDYATDGEGKLNYVFDEFSHLQPGSNTVTVIARGGGTSANTTVVQTVKPLENDIVVAITERGVVTADRVPNDVLMTLYNENNEVIAKAGPTVNGTARIVLTVSEKEKLAEAAVIKAGYSKIGEVKSVKVPVSPLDRNSAPEEEEVVTNAKDNTVTVKKVPPGTTVNVYDDEDIVIGTGTNDGPTEQDIIITIDAPTVLKKGDKVKVSIEDDEKMESERIPSVAKDVSESPDEENILANATNNKVTVKDLPPGTEVNVYDENGELIGTATNGGPNDEDVVVHIRAPHVLKKDDIVNVTVTLPGTLESSPVPSQAKLESDPPAPNDVTTNAGDNTVTVKDVPPGTTVNVYDENDVLIGTATNEGPSEEDIVVTIKAPTVLQKGDKVTVSTRDEGKLESERVPSEAKLVSQSPDEEKVTANASDNTVTVKDVPPGTTVNVYDKDGKLIGTATNTGSNEDDVVVTINAPHALEKDEIVDVTLTLPGSLESPPVPSQAKLESDPPAPNDVTTNATDNTVTVKHVRPGTTVNVYDENDVLIGTATNDGPTEEDVVVTIKAPTVLQKGDKVKVSTKEEDKIESDRVPSEAELVSEAPEAEKITANASDNKVTVKDVPPGTTVNVYDKDGKLIGTATNTGSDNEDVVVTIAAPHVLAEDEVIDVTVKLPGSLESPPVPSQAKLESIPPVVNDVVVSIPKGTVTVEDVPEGATVIIYDDKGDEWKRNANTDTKTGPVVITGLELVPGTKINVTIIEKNKYESKPLVIVAEYTADEAIDDALKKLQIGYHEEDTWESVTHPVFIVSAGANNTKIEWTSSKPNSIEIVSPEDETIETKVHRGEKDESVILTASISKNGVTKTKTFLLIVKSSSITDKKTDTNYRTVKVIGGSSDEVNETARIDRISLSNGVKIDKAIFDAAAAARFINDARTNNGVATVFVDEVLNDEPGEIAVEIPRQSVELLSGNGNSLDVRTEYATVSISANVLEQMAGNYLDLFFRLIPVKDASQQAQLNAAITNEPVVKTAAGSRDAVVIGSSLEIETNYRDYATKLFLPFGKNGITVPAGNASDFLNSLRVYVEHSDGEKVVKTGTVIYDAGTPIGLEIDIDKFSVFTILQLKYRPVGYIPVPPVVTLPQGTDQVKTAVIDVDKGTIALELANGTGDVDKSGFTVKIGNQNVEIKEISINGNQVTITLKNAIPAGYEAVISYKPSTGTGAANGALTAFADLKIANPAYHVAYIKGFPDGTFRPDKTVTRAEMSAILARNKYLPESSPYQALYPDVAQGYWATSYIEQLKDVGLLIGDDNGNFRPGDRITRAEMAMVAARWLNADLKGTFQNSFEDVSDSHWAAAAIAAVSEAGIMIGFEDGTFGLNKYVTRAQAVTIMNRLLGRGPLTGVPTPTWPDGGSHWASEHIEEASQDHHYTYLPDGRELLYQN
ncbi:S-layer homology domain-containing protein [Paenibacillus sp. CAU 1782]